MLEDAAHQHLLVAGETILGAVAVVHVEIDDRHPFEAVGLQGMAGGNADVVEEAEAHGVGPFRRGGRGRMAQKAFSIACIRRSTASTPAPAERTPPARCRDSSLCPGQGGRCRFGREARFRRSRWTAGWTRSNCSKGGQRGVVIGEVGVYAPGRSGDR